MFDKDNIVTFYRDRNAKFIPLINQALDLVYCNDIKEVLLMLDEYEVWMNLTLTRVGYLQTALSLLDICSFSQHQEICFQCYI